MANWELDNGALVQNPIFPRHLFLPQNSAKCRKLIRANYKSGALSSFKYANIAFQRKINFPYLY